MHVIPTEPTYSGQEPAVKRVAIGIYVALEQAQSWGDLWRNGVL